jgi:hypothetical protein
MESDETTAASNQEAEPRTPPQPDADQDSPQVHTGLDEEHPAGGGPRSDRDIGGPTSEPDAEPAEGGAPGSSPGSAFEPHE